MGSPRNHGAASDFVGFSVMPIAVARALRTDRLRDVGIASALLLWLVYTRLYFVLQAMHLGAPTCVFYLVTGPPCPFCRGTRSFAFMWRRGRSEAVRRVPQGSVL